MLSSHHAEKELTKSFFHPTFFINQNNTKMTKLYQIFKTQLLLAVVLMGASMGYAQTVTVPSNCRVVITDTTLGGVLGFGGKVTNGGMVAMPDAITTVAPIQYNQGGIFTFNPPTATPAITTATWSLKGDISNTAVAGATPGVTGNYNNVSQPPASLSAKIFSYNKFYRANSTETSGPSFAKSKGQVRVAYIQAPCNNSITFDIFKTFDKAPDIVGPSCLKPLTTYTYSVDRIVSDNPNDNIGFDSYYWTLPASAYATGTFYTSADTSSITFTTGTTVTGFNLTCCLGRVNPNTADGGPSSVNLPVTPARTVCTTKQIITAPVPTFVTAPPTCVPTGTVAAPAIFSITYPNVVAGTVYTWTAANTGWGGPLTSTFIPVVNSPAAGQTTLTINTLGNNNPGELTLTITGPCDPAIIKYQINRNIASPIAVTATGTTTYCLASTASGNTYTLSPTTSSSILWTTDPASLAGVSLQNTSSATVTVVTTSAAVGTFKLVATATGTCNTTNVFATINIQPATPVFTTGTTGTPSCVVKSATATVSSIAVTPAGGAGTYSWTYPTGVTCTNCDTSNPTFILNSVGASAILKVKAIGPNGCNSAEIQKTINYIQVATSAPGGGFADTYLVNGLCGTVTSWTIGTGVAPTQLFTTYTATSGNVSITNSGVGTNNSCAISGTTGVPITSVCANLPGGITVCAATLGSLTQRLANSSTIGTTKEIIEGVSIYPNPNNGVFFVKVEDIKETATAILNDFSGKEIASYMLKKGNNKLGNEELPEGTYFIVLTIDGKQETRQIVVK